MWSYEEYLPGLHADECSLPQWILTRTSNELTQPSKFSVCIWGYCWRSRARPLIFRRKKNKSGNNSKGIYSTAAFWTEWCLNPKDKLIHSSSRFTLKHMPNSRLFSINFYGAKFFSLPPFTEQHDAPHHPLTTFPWLYRTHRKIISSMSENPPSYFMACMIKKQEKYAIYKMIICSKMGLLS